MNKEDHLADLANYLMKNYDPKTMDFYQWLNTFEYIVDLLNVPEYEKVKFLLKFMDPLPLSELQLKVSPENPFTLSYEVLVMNFEQMYGIFYSQYAAHYRFYIRDQIIGENVVHYVYSLGKILKKACVSLRNNEVLMKRFVNGLIDPVMRKEMSSKQFFTLDDAIIYARQLEIKQGSIIQKVGKKYI